MKFFWIILLIPVFSFAQYENCQPTSAGEPLPFKFGPDGKTVVLKDNAAFKVTAKDMGEKTDVLEYQRLGEVNPYSGAVLTYEKPIQSKLIIQRSDNRPISYTVIQNRRDTKLDSRQNNATQSHIVYDDQGACYLEKRLTYHTGAGSVENPRIQYDMELCREMNQIRDDNDISPHDLDKCDSYLKGISEVFRNYKKSASGGVNVYKDGGGTRKYKAPLDGSMFIDGEFKSMSVKGEALDSAMMHAMACSYNIANIAIPQPAAAAAGSAVPGQSKKRSGEK